MLTAGKTAFLLQKLSKGNIKMGLFSKPKTQTVVQQAEQASTEKKETTAKKQRLLETEGGNKGAELTAQQGQSVRRIFG